MKQCSWKFPLTERQGELIKAEKERRIVAALVALQGLCAAPEVKELIRGVVLAQIQPTSLSEETFYELVLSEAGLRELTRRVNGGYMSNQVIEPTREIVAKYDLKAEEIAALHLALQVSDPAKLLGD